MIGPDPDAAPPRKVEHGGRTTRAIRLARAVRENVLEHFAGIPFASVRTAISFDTGRAFFVLRDAESLLIVRTLCITVTKADDGEPRVAFENYGHGIPREELPEPYRCIATMAPALRLMTMTDEKRNRVEYLLSAWRPAP